MLPSSSCKSSTETAVRDPLVGVATSVVVGVALVVGVAVVVAIGVEEGTPAAVSLEVVDKERFSNKLVLEIEVVTSWMTSFLTLSNVVEIDRGAAGREGRNMRCTFPGGKDCSRPTTSL
jgi:hypothetical protein